MDRYVLTDAQWAKMEPHCLGKKSDPGRSGEDNRRFVEAVLWIARTGSPWRDLPPLFGPWNTVFKRYRDWVKANTVHLSTRIAVAKSIRVVGCGVKGRSG
jgi:transposase